MPRISKMRGHRGYNICPWLKNGKRETCGKSCHEQYCKVHRFKIRNGRKIPRPCLSCGVGVISQIQLCRGCGRETERKRLARQALQDKTPEELEPGGTMVPFVPFSSPTTLCTTLPSEHRAYDETTESGWRRPKESMINDEYCFGLRDWKRQ